MKKIAIIGAGISGATLARALADRGICCEIFEAHSSVGGMCREIQWHSQTVSEFGPHVFRTFKPLIWAFVSRFCELIRCEHCVSSLIHGELRSFPPLELSANEASSAFWQEGYSSVGDYLVTTVGPKLFSEFYEHYTLKRWGVSAFALAPDMIPMVPVFRKNASIFSEALVGIPRSGFTRALENMIDHPFIQCSLGEKISADDLKAFDTAVWTGRPDRLSLRSCDALPFRAVRQIFEPVGDWPLPSVSVINYPGRDVQYIRRTNYETLCPWRPKVMGVEYCGTEGYPAYPVRTQESVQAAANIDRKIATLFPNIVLHGRLGLFSYISIDKAIENSLALAEHLTLGMR